MQLVIIIVKQNPLQAAIFGTIIVKMKSKNGRNTQKITKFG